ncbi:MAG: hypothetical protein WC713_04115 [Candidatus Methylomirabilota bacterium]
MLADIIHKVAQALHDDSQPYHPRPSMCSPEFEDTPGRCVRQMVYHRLEVPHRPLPGRAVLVFDDGHWHEEASAKWIEKTAIRLHDRQLGVDIRLPRPIGQPYVCTVCKGPVDPGTLHGHIDGLLTDPIGVTRLWEHKAVSHFAFQEALEGELPLDYIAQGCCYLSSETLRARGVREAVLLLKSKNTSAYCEFRFSYDPEHDCCTMMEMLASDGTSSALNETVDGILTSAYAKFAVAEELADRLVFPARSYRQDHWRCSYCLWGGTCWDGYAAEVASRAMVTALPVLAPMLEEYYVAKRAKGQGEQVMKKLRPLILAALERNQTKAARANGLTAAVCTQERSDLDQELLPPPIKKAATRNKTVEILKVTRTGDRTNGHGDGQQENGEEPEEKAGDTT